MGQAAFITGSAIFLVIEAVPRFFAPHPVSHSGIGMAVMAFSIVATVALVALQRHVIRRTGSLAISADRLHYRSEEHTSELQSLMRISYAVFCLKNKNTQQSHTQH